MHVLATETYALVEECASHCVRQGSFIEEGV